LSPAKQKASCTLYSTGGFSICQVKTVYLRRKTVILDRPRGVIRYRAHILAPPILSLLYLCVTPRCETLRRPCFARQNLATPLPYISAPVAALPLLITSSLRLCRALRGFALAILSTSTLYLCLAQQDYAEQLLCFASRHHALAIQ
tara:strand:- start:3826 stop:4263 length:438 start_codon:yes stop_codon:yes gene_type:complete